MKSLVGENSMLLKLQHTFILGKTEVDFHERLKSLAQLLLDNKQVVLSESKRKSKSNAKT